MTPRLVAVLASLGPLACSFGIVDVPEAGLEVTRLGLDIETTDSVEGRLIVSGRLQPGDLPKGREREVSDPTLEVLDVSLTGAWTVDPTGALLLWSDTVQATPADEGAIPLRLPRVEGVNAPPPPSMVLRHAAGRSGDPAGWVVGSDLKLFMRPAQTDEDAPTQTQWRLDVAVLDSRGTSLGSVALLVTAQVPDTITIPQSWLSAPSGGSLEATIRLNRTYRSVDPEGAYEVFATLRQRFRWSIPVR